MTTLIPKVDFKNGGTTPAGAINRPINEKLQEIVSVKDFGAKGDGTTDDAAAITAAIAAMTTGGILYFPTGSYVVASTIIVDKDDVILDFNNQSVSYSASYVKIGSGDFGIYNVMFAITANRVTCVNGQFKQGAFTDSGSFVWYATTAQSGIVDKCKFYDEPYVIVNGVYGLTNGVAIQTRTGSTDIKITNCYFYNCSGSISMQGKNGVIDNCSAYITSAQVTGIPGATDQAFGIDGSTGCSITNCKVIRSVGAPYSGTNIGANSTTTNFNISNNYVYGLSGGIGISVLNSNNGVLSGNEVDGGGFTAVGPWALIRLDTDSLAIICSNNLMRNAPISYIGSALNLYTGNHQVLNNSILVETGYVFACVTIDMATTANTILFSGNTLSSVGIGVAFQMGNNNNIPVMLKNNVYQGPMTTPYYAPTLPINAPLYIENEFFVGTSITTYAINTNKFFRPLYYGSMGKFPFSIKQNAVFYSGEVPTGANYTGATWAVGDTVYNSSPSVGQPKGWTCTVAGTPGTWVSMGNL